MEIPEYIRFDFLLGAFSFVIGIYFIKYSYDLDMEIKELEYAKKKYEYVEFFENKNILTKKSKEEHQKDIKDMINQNK